MTRGNPHQSHGRRSPAILRRTMGRSVLALLAAKGLALPLAPSALAAGPSGTLTVGLAAVPTSLDPHFQVHGPNMALHRHMYEGLVGVGPRLEPIPELAVSWRTRDPLTWEFRLRRNVLWHDGSAFTAQDVIASYRRVPLVENSPSSFVPFTRQIASMEAEDDHTLVLRTDAPFPLMANLLAAVSIIPARIAASAKTPDFNALTAAIGTGPYRVTGYRHGQEIVVEANRNHWAGPPSFERITLRPITATGSRVAALLAQDVDLIEQPPPLGVSRLRANPRVRLWEIEGNRIVYFGFDLWRDHAVGVTAHDGRPIPNPFRDLRVRQALSLAINREAICERVMDGLAVPANQMVPEGVFGHAPSIPRSQYNPEGARQLLVEAGLPDGFRMTIHGTSDRLVNDTQMLQAVAQMFSRIGVRAEVDAMPATVFFPRVERREFSFFFNSWGTGTSGAMTTVGTALMTYDAERGEGRGNRGRYSNPEVDRRMQTAFRTVDDVARERLLQEATAIAMADVAVIPTHIMKNIWASHTDIQYEPRLDGNTLAARAKRAA